MNQLGVDAVISCIFFIIGYNCICLTVTIFMGQMLFIFILIIHIISKPYTILFNLKKRIIKKKTHRVALTTNSVLTDGHSLPPKRIFMKDRSQFQPMGAQIQNNSRTMLSLRDCLSCRISRYTSLQTIF